MSKEMEFFIYLMESYALSKNVPAGDMLGLLEEKGLTDFVCGMYEMYHSEAIENAFMDLDSLIATGKPRW